MTTVRRIFLAHAREDKSQVRKLYADLKSRGLDPWLDEIDLMPGQIWKDEIPKAIRGAAVFLACLSSRSVDKVGYVQNEFRLALSAFGERPPGSIYLIPVRLDDCNVPDLQIADRGLSLKDIHWVDLWQEGGLDRLVTSIGRTLAVGTPSPQVVEAPSTHPPSATGSVIVQGDYSGLTTVFTAPHDTREARALSVRHPAIVAAIIGALGAVAAALSPWLLQHISDDNGKPLKATSPEETSTTAGVPENNREFRDCEGCPLMVALPAGSFMMGTTQPKGAVNQADQPWIEGEKPQHRVEIEHAFAIGKYEVTFDEWDFCVSDGGCNGYKPGREDWPGGRRPVINVSWNDAKAYVEWLSNLTGAPYRLPSEAEWEYAARAGTTTRFWWGDDDPTHGQANFGYYVAKTKEAGSYPANHWGLHDMNGNVSEWVEDCSNLSYEDPGRPNDGKAWLQGDCSYRMLRGGAWSDPTPVLLRSAGRNGLLHDGRSFNIGFRVARTLSRSESVTP